MRSAERLILQIRHEKRFLVRLSREKAARLLYDTHREEAFLRL